MKRLLPLWFLILTGLAPCPANPGDAVHKARAKEVAEELQCLAGTEAPVRIRITRHARRGGPGSLMQRELGADEATLMLRILRKATPILNRGDRMFTPVSVTHIAINSAADGRTLMKLRDFEVDITENVAKGQHKRLAHLALPRQDYQRFRELLKQSLE